MRFSAVILCVLALGSAAAPVVEGLLHTDIANVDLYARFAGISLAHPLGTDELGRDVLVRLLYGGRISLAVATVAALFSATLGAAIGLVAGYYGGWADRLLMRLTDSIIALPMLPLLIVLAAVDLRELGIDAQTAQAPLTSFYRIVFIIALFGWTTAARLVRAGTLRAKAMDYVRAARALGAGSGRILLVHILPNVAAPLIVAMTLTTGHIILLESVLSFLGLGIQPPLPSWGNMLTGAQDLVWDHPLLMVWPGLMIFMTVMALNFLGDWLQAALDPRRRAALRA